MFQKISHSTGVTDEEEILFSTPFNYLFPEAARSAACLLPVSLNTIQGLKALGNAMADNGSIGDPAGQGDSQIDALFTYIGQFIDHDITARTDRDTTISDLSNESAITPANPDNVIKTLKNGRRPQLDLDSVFGEGPGLAGSTAQAKTQSQILYNNDLKLNLFKNGSRIDLPRQQINNPDPVQQAIIADGRNDENLNISQIQALFLSFYNHVYDVLSGTKEEKYIRARQLVRWSYQYAVVHDYLMAVCDRNIVLDVLANGPRFYSSTAGKGETFMPLEFSVAAFRFGHSMMAIDGTVESLPDTAANAAFFGRHHSDRGEAAWPQVQCVYLAECGTHAIVDAGFWPIHTSERVGGHRLLRSVTADMLVMWDRGFHDYEMIVAVRQRQAHVLSRLPAHVKPERVQTLPDGSWLAYIYPSDYQRRQQGERCLVRIIEYKVSDPALADPNETHRLLTTLLDAECCPAVALICAYHERWEIEIAIDEMDTHQRLSAKTLRSLKPVGVIQELYGLLIAHFIIRSLMHEAALQANIAPSQLSFVHAVEVIKDAIPEFQMVAKDQREQLYQRLLKDMARRPLPERRNRVNPRVVKQKMSKFLRKRQEHYQWPQPESSFPEALVVI